MAMDSIERTRRLRAIRRLSPSFPRHTAAERLEKIEGIANGKTDPSIVRRKPSADLAERLAAGIASRSPRIQDRHKIKDKKKAAFTEREEEKKATDEKKRKSRLGRDRQERGGQDRSE